jgi:hypothetical protein
MASRLEPNWDVPQVSRYSGFSTHQVYRAAKASPPRLRGYKSGPYGPWFFKKRDVDAWLDSMSNMPTQPAEESTPSPRSSRRRTSAVSR